MTAGRPGPSRPVVTRPPVGATHQELEAWADSFLGQLLGPEETQDVTSGEQPDP